MSRFAKIAVSLVALLALATALQACTKKDGRKKREPNAFVRLP